MLASHLWILSKLLVMKESSTQEINTKHSNDSEGAYRVEHLLCYVIATSYPNLFDDFMQHDQPKSTENTNDHILANFVFASPSFRSLIPDIVSQAKLAVDKKPV